MKLNLKRKRKDFDKIKQLEIELVKIKYVDEPDKLQNALRELKKAEVID